MVPDNFILQHWDEQHRIFISNLHALRHKAGRNPAHDLRVSIKKIRSYLKLAQEISGNEWKNEFIGTKELFSTVGKYHDVRVSISLVNYYQKNQHFVIPSFKKQLKAMLSIVRNWLGKAVKDYDEKKFELLTGFVQSSLSGYTNEALEKKIGELVENKFSEAGKLTDHFKKNAHRIRKLLKDIYYWLKTCPANPVFDEAQMKQFDKALENLGSWQDLFVLEKKLKHLRKEYLLKRSGEFSAASEFEKFLKKEKDDLLSSAEKKIRELNIKK